MQYSLWSRGRLLGETDLGFVYREDGFRCGWLHPTSLGERLLPIAAGVGPALRTYRVIGPDDSARADALSAIDHEAALELELRGAGNHVLRTESIDVIDTHYLMSIPQNDPDSDIDSRADAEIEEIEAVLEESRETESQPFSCEEQNSRVIKSRFDSSIPSGYPNAAR